MGRKTEKCNIVIKTT